MKGRAVQCNAVKCSLDPHLKNPRGSDHTCNCR
jgi:hypothetical protein